MTTLPSEFLTEAMGLVWPEWMYCNYTSLSPVADEKQRFDASMDGITLLLYTLALEAYTYNGSKIDESVDERHVRLTELVFPPEDANPPYTLLDHKKHLDITTDLLYLMGKLLDDDEFFPFDDSDMNGAYNRMKHILDTQTKGVERCQKK